MIEYKSGTNHRVKKIRDRYNLRILNKKTLTKNIHMVINKIDIRIGDSEYALFETDFSIGAHVVIPRVGEVLTFLGSYAGVTKAVEVERVEYVSDLYALKEKDAKSGLFSSGRHNRPSKAILHTKEVS